MALRHELSLPIQGHSGETGLGPGGGDIRLRCLALRLQAADIQPGQDVALGHLIANIHTQMPDLTALRKTERTLATGRDQRREPAFILRRI